MSPTTRTLGSIPFTFLTISILSFLINYLVTSRTQDKDAVAHSTPTFTPDDKTPININHFHGPVTIQHHHHHHPKPTQHSSFAAEQLGSFAFVAFCAFGIAWVAFILWLNLGHARPIEQPATTSSSESIRRVGRTPSIVSGSKLGCSDVSDPNSPGASLPIARGTTANRTTRGRRFALQDSGLSSTPPPWKVKEPASLSGGDRMPSWTSVAKHLEERSNPVDCELTIRSGAASPTSSPNLRALRHPVQAPPLPQLQASTSNQAPGLYDPIASGRLKQVKAKARFIPYRGPSTPSVRRRYRGSTPVTVEAHQVERRASLETTLYGNPCILQPGPIVWFILIVAVNYGSLQDPKHDLEFWKKMLKDPALVFEAIRFTELTDEDATPENIKKAIAQLWHDSCAPGINGRPNLFVYLTGEGDRQNRMCLLNRKFISEADIGQWLSELRAASEYAQPITLVLDICRMNKCKLSATMDCGVELICSSSPGEKALALRFNSEQDTPYSAFILAFLIASSVSPTSTSAEFVTVVEQRLDQLTGLIKASARARGCEDPGPQRPDWSQANNSSTFLELARMVSQTTVMREVYSFVTQLDYFREESAATSSTADYGPVPKGRTSHHYRGVNKHAPVICS